MAVHIAANSALFMVRTGPGLNGCGVKLPFDIPGDNPKVTR